MTETNNQLSPTFSLTIEALDENSMGVGYYKDKKIAVEKTLPGEEVDVSYVPNRPKKDRIVLKKIKSVSDKRVTPPCPWFQKCGGCQLQHLTYQDQLTLKRNLILRQLSRYSMMKNISVQPVEGLSNPFYYRNKTQIPFKNINHRIVYGLYRKGTHEIVPIDKCMVENREANQVLKIVREWAEKYHIPLYRETDQTGNLRYVVIRKGEFTGQIMVVLVINQPTISHLPELQKILQARISGLSSIILNYNSTTGNTILSEKNEVIWGKAFIEETVMGIHFRIYPNTFFQINPVQAVRMIRKLQSLISLDKHQTILDLFCGIGMMGLVNARQAKKIIGIDLNAHAISAAQENSTLNHVENLVILKKRN